MSDNNAKNRLLVKNTLMLYLRTFIVMVVSLFTVRIIFQTLGVNDYGVYNVVSGFVTMFSFITGSLSVTISRFLSIEIGRGNLENLKRMFANSLYCMVAVGVFLIVIIEFIGVPFLNYKMNIIPERMFAANCVLQLSIITLFIQVFTIAFDALVISAEKMSVYAYISIFDIVLKLAISYAIIISPIDKLIVYSILLVIQSGIILFVYGVYCHNKVLLLPLGEKINYPIIREIASVTGWDLFGSSSLMLKNYGGNILLNLFFGTIINASRGIAMQINAALTKFSGGFLTALRPQIMKAYATGDKYRFFMLIDKGTRLSTYLLLLISIPIMLESHYIINLWLGEVPAHCESFVVLIIILSISEGTMVYSHNAALMALGRIKKCQILTGILQLLNLPIAYLFLKVGASPESTIVVAIVIAHICCFVRLYILQEYTGYSIKRFITSTYLRLFIVSILSVSLPLLIQKTMDESFLRLMIITIICFIMTAFVVFYIGCEKAERKRIIDFLLNKLNR